MFLDSPQNSCDSKCFLHLLPLKMKKKHILVSKFWVSIQIFINKGNFSNENPFRCKYFCIRPYFWIDLVKKVWIVFSIILFEITRMSLYRRDILDVASSWRGICNCKHDKTLKCDEQKKERSKLALRNRQT